MRKAIPLAVYLCLATTQLAAAENESVVVVVRGDNPEREEASRAGVEAALRDRGFAILPFRDVVVNRGLDPAEVEGCSDSGSDCMQKAVSAAQSDRVVLLILKSTTASDGEIQVVVVGWYIDGKSGRRLQGDQRFCERCTTLEELAGVAKELGGQLADLDASRAAPETWIKVQTQPANAKISIDGKVVGVAGQRYRVSPGEHDVRIDLAGFEPVSERVAVAANETREMRIRLARVEDETFSASPALTWGTFGAGAALTTIGIVWLAVDGERIKNGERLPEKRNTQVPGVIATSVGAALLATSVVFFLTRSDEAEEPRGVAIVPTRDGVSVGFSGRF